MTESKKSEGRSEKSYFVLRTLYFVLAITFVISRHFTFLLLSIFWAHIQIAIRRVQQ
jgi:hypothetical protein